MMRQGLAMSFFYGLLYPLLIKNKNVQYYIGSFLIGFIHASSWLFFLFPILKNIKLNNHYLLFFIISIVIMFVSSSILDYIPIPFIKARIEYYTGESSDNAILAKLFRMIVLIPFVLLQNDNIHNENIKISSKFMLYAFFFYSIFAFSELTASRIWGLFLGFECLFLANISFAIRKSAKRLKLLAFFSVLLIIMWFKDIGAAINQGEYRHCNMFTYPYFSIMEEEDDLDYYRGNKQI